MRVLSFSRSLLSKLFSSTFLKGSVILTVATFAVSVLNYLFNLLVVRGVPVADYGEYSSANAYVVLLTIPFGALGSLLIRKIGQLEPDQRVAFIHHTEQWVIKKLTSQPLLAPTLALGVFFLLRLGSNLSVASLAFILIMIIVSALQVFYASAFQGLQVFLLYGALLVLSALLRLLGGIGAIAISGKLEVIFFFIICASLVFCISSIFFFAKKRIRRVRVSNTFSNISLRRLSKNLTVPLLMTLGVIGLANVDVILAKKFLSSSDAGLYSAFALLAKIVFFVTGPLSSVGYIFFTDKKHQHQKKHHLLIIIGLTLAVGCSATLAYQHFADFFISFFLDQRFLSFAQILWLGGVYGTLYSLIYLCAQYFLATNSWFSTLAFLGCIAQSIGIAFFHSTLQMVMLVNIFILFVLLIAYLIIFSIQWFQYKSLTSNHGKKWHSLY